MAKAVIYREAWLERAIEQMRDDLFTPASYTLPDKVRASIGFPSQNATARKNRRIGECWTPTASSDGYTEIWISPTIPGAVGLLGTLAHELIHASVGVEAGHRGPFKRAMQAIGLEGKPTATTPGPRVVEWANAFVSRVGDFPGGVLDVGARPVKKDGTRLIKCECAACGYVARVTRKWIFLSGAPICPGGADRGPMQYELPDEPEDDDE